MKRKPKKAAGNTTKVKPLDAFDLALDAESARYPIESAKHVLGILWESLGCDDEKENLLHAIDAVLDKALAENRTLHAQLLKAHYAAKGGAK